MKQSARKLSRTQTLRAIKHHLTKGGNKMKTDNATPRPWGIGLTVNGSKRIMAEHWPVADIAIDRTSFQKEHEANAELIVRAVNAHDELVKACKGLLKLAYKATNDDSWIEIAEQAIAKAELQP